MKIEAGKTYRTRSGLKVRILETGLKSTWPVVGVVTHKDGKEQVYRCTEKGEGANSGGLGLVSSYEDIKVGDPVITEGGYIRVFAGVNEEGKPTVFDDNLRSPKAEEFVESFPHKAKEPWRKVLKDLLDYAWSKTCLHEDTYSGGAMWEICDQCGKKWAEYEGGKPENVTPKAIQAAEELLK